MSGKTNTNRSSLTPSRRRRIDVLLKLAELLTKPRHRRGPTIAQLVQATGYSRASVYRFLEEIRRLGFELRRELVNGGAHYSLPPGSVHHLAKRLVVSLVRHTAGERLNACFAEALANDAATTQGDRQCG